MILSLILAASQPQPPPPPDPEQMSYIKSAIARFDRVRRLSDDQALMVYDQCLARGAASASRTTVADDAVFGLAYAQCSRLRLDLLMGQAPARFVAFKQLDDVKRAAFPELTRKLREQRNTLGVAEP